MKIRQSLTIGVIIVAYDSGAVIVDCLESLFSAPDADLRVVIVDNASTDDVISIIRSAGVDAERMDCEAPPRLLLQDRPVVLRSDQNLGFAGGVNLGLEFLRKHEEVDLFWILNPDTIVAKNTPVAIAAGAKENPDFDVMGGRICYFAEPNIIQNDGGRVNFWTGACQPVNMFREADKTSTPPAQSLDYISGAHIVVSRGFLAKAGLMPERYFLYYEETDWCLTLPDRKLVFLADAVAYHHGGTSIGSATIDRSASPLSSYFMARSRLKFVRKFRPFALPIAMGFNLLKAAQSVLRGDIAEATANLRGSFGLPPTASIKAKIRV
ncbi:MAG: glycosyltransferase family 2 protein [Erythrobacter sp.]|uniref:glycosyltransferase family 2 protein n=1 Tax=Erythrobacter sp. TaxID=1042 RepID=UPI00326634FD